MLTVLMVLTFASAAPVTADGADWGCVKRHGEISTDDAYGLVLYNGCDSAQQCSFEYSYNCTHDGGEFDTVRGTCSGGVGERFHCTMRHSCSGEWSWKVVKWRCGGK